MQTVKGVPLKLDPFAQRIADILEAHGIDLYSVRSDSVRIEVRDNFGPVLVGELFIPISLEDLMGE